MIKSFHRNILVLDNDFLVYVLKNNYDIDKGIVDKIFQQIALNYSTIWIPSIVMEEFMLKCNDKNRQKRIDELFEKYHFITECPISVGTNEILGLIGTKEENSGEADAILQIQKASSCIDISFEKIVFLTNDKGAMNLAELMNIEIWKYEDLKNIFKEIGISIV